MTNVRVKICGVTTAEAWSAAREAGAAWIGLVFYPPSPRALTPIRAAALASRFPGDEEAMVGLFVNPADEALAETLAAVPLRTVQLHGVSPNRARAIRERFGVAVWRAVGVAAAADLPAAESGLDGLLLDAKAAPGATRPGGNGAAFDWRALEGWTRPPFWMLAGGLTPGTVRAAIEATGAPAVDVSSGVESAPGVKDADLIRRFTRAARS